MQKHEQNIPPGDQCERRQGVPFNTFEFQLILGQLRSGQKADDYTLWCLAEQIEANRVDIEKLRILAAEQLK